MFNIETSCADTRDDQVADTALSGRICKLVKLYLFEVFNALFRPLDLLASKRLANFGTGILNFEDRTEVATPKLAKYSV